MDRSDERSVDGVAETGDRRMSMQRHESTSPVLSGCGLRVAFGPTKAPRGVDIDIHAGRSIYGRGQVVSAEGFR